MRKQRGFIRMEGLGELIVFAIIGIAATIGGLGWLVWWLIKHIAFI